MSENENTVDEVLTANEHAAVYAMTNVTSSNGALAGAKSYFVHERDIDYHDADATLFTKSYGSADNVAAVKYD